MSNPQSISESDGAPIPVVVIAAPVSKFCRVCGAPWQIEWQACVHCSKKTDRPASTLTIASEWRAMKSALWLYFSLLAVCAIGLGLSRAYGSVGLEMGVSVALSLITILWCAGSAGSVVPVLRKVPRLLWFALALGLSLPTYGIAVAVIHGFNQFLHLPNDSMSGPFIKAGYGWTTAIVFICVQPAIIEELAFRGVIFAAVSKALNGTETILVSAMMFMILHLSPMRFPHTLALGLGAGFLRYRTRSIYPCMLMHFSHNLLCIAAEWAAR